MCYATKAMDTTGPCIGTSGNFQVVSDIYDLHDYIQDIEELKKIYLAPTYEAFAEEYDKRHWGIAKYQKTIDYKDMALYLSEYGGIRWDVNNTSCPTDTEPWIAPPSLASMMFSSVPCHGIRS